MGVVAPERERERERERKRTEPAQKPGRPPSGFPWGGVLALAGVIVLIVGVRDWLPDLIPSIPNPFAETTIDRSRPAVLQSVRDLSEYHAAGGHYEVVVDIQKDTPLPAGLLGERTLFIGVGDVDAVVDFGSLDDGAITTSGDRRDATIVVPPPRTSRPRLDLQQSYVYDQQEGVLNEIGGLFSDDADAQREVYLVAERRIAEAARRGGGLNGRARANTRAMLQSLLGGLGFQRVTVRFADES
jgi:uncharacterized protein DUF4230